VTPEDKQALFRVAQWTFEHKYLRVKTIRQLAGTEENYRIIIREIDRVKAQIQHARTLDAEATLTIMDWLRILEQFEWQCAYCQTKPFEIMSHIIPLPHGGTTPQNCVPACYRCITGTGKRQALIREGYQIIR
jgi:5-methylcytosine-specific restriction endonuclease McrA